MDHNVLTKELMELINDNAYELTIMSFIKNDPGLFSLSDKVNDKLLSNIISIQAKRKWSDLKVLKFLSFNELCLYLLKELNLDIDLFSSLSGIKNIILRSFLEGRRSCLSLGSKSISSILFLLSIRLSVFVNILTESYQDQALMSLPFSNATKFIGSQSLIQGADRKKGKSKRSFNSFIERVRNSLILKGRKDLCE